MSVVVILSAKASLNNKVGDDEVLLIPFGLQKPMPLNVNIMIAIPLTSGFDSYNKMLPLGQAPNRCGEYLDCC